MTLTDVQLTQSQVQLLKARATQYSQFRQQKALSADHGNLAKEIDQYLAYGLLKHGFDETLPGELSQSVFVPFNKCLTVCMENGIQQNKGGCQICEDIVGLTKHSCVCMGHPEACPTCKSFFNLLEYHLLNCETCDMHLCTRLKLKLLKYQSTVKPGLVDLWPKIQQYISRLCPPVIATMTSNYRPTFRNRLDTFQYPSIFDSGSETPTSPKSPKLIARGGENDQTAVPVPRVPTISGTGLGIEWEEYNADMAAIANNFGNTFEVQNGPPSSTLIGMAAADHMSFMSGDVFMSTSFSSADSLESRLKMNDGYGGVIMGEPRQLRQLADYWITLKKRLAGANLSQRSRSFRTEVDGILLKGVNSGMQTVHGQYKKNEQWRKVTYVGGGVAGKCYLAVDINSEAQFAVKKIELLKYQSEELELWSELEHPNLVQLFGACRVKNKIYIFSEFYAAGTLAEFIESQKMLNQWLSLWFLSQLLDSLIYLTKKNILHDDIKADNIFLKPDSYQLGLGDFGLSRKGQCPPNMNPVGGQHHWSPEKARSEGHGFPADLWAAICTLVHMLSGDPPWKRRFEETKWLHYTIGHESPPIQDIPENLLTIVDTLIRKAWTVDASERPAAADLLEDECFQIIFDRHDYNDPIFRSHFPVATEEDEEMELDTDESEFYVSVDDLLDGMENKEQAAEYLNMICATLTDQEFDTVPPGAFGSTRTAGSPSATGGTSTAKRLYSIKRPLMESIVEEKDVVHLSEDDSLHLSQKNILERREMPAVTPLVLPKRSASPGCLEKRSSWGRSNTSPSPSSELSLQSKRDTLRKQETSPAIILSAVPIDDELVGEKDIFDLNPSTSGYQTGSTQMQFSEGPSLAPSDPSLSNLGDVSNVWSQQWLGASSSSHWNGDQSRDFGSNMGEVQSNRMGLIQLDTEYNATSATMPEKLELSSSLQIFKDSFSSSSIEPKGTLTLVNGLTMIDQIEVSVKGKETWRDIIEQNMSKVKHWNLESYTYYLTTNTDEPGSEVKVNESVPKDKIDVFVYPSQTSSTWHVHNNRITYA